MPPDPVLTLADLENWSRTAPSLAVLGHPIGHSLSPPMHNAALAELAKEKARFADWRYFRFDVPPADLPRALELLRAKRFRGVNLTVPHKVIAFDLVAEIDPAARAAGAVNTLLGTDRGWHGFNTDGYGLSMALAEALGRELKGAAVILLGAGGAARAAAVECLARGCAGLRIVNRTKVNGDALLEVLRPLAGEIPIGRLGEPAVSSDVDATARRVGSGQLPLLPRPPAHLVINATSSGLKPGDAAAVDLTTLPPVAGVFDMIYNPPRTPLLLQAEALGIPGANGLAMLAHQGAKSLEIWTGVPAAKTAPVMLATIAALSAASAA